MDAKKYAPFVDAFAEILPQLGFQAVKRGNLSLKEKLMATRDITAIVGLTKKIRGNVAYGMAEDTAKNIASIMMGGMPVENFDEMAQSAISELANMVTANAAISLENIGLETNISPPTLVVGKNITARISQVKSLMVEIITEAGSIEINIGLEI
ncbi:chemotaxis protein CheX [Desulfotomaculum sp. 1211_IL3151]|uniref:chemotaxis protein CheX n=1 Tax=Desulfotomaculum sp. 1211_IL3151 TaxID=3084055 RepID=UPI002FD9E389